MHYPPGDGAPDHHKAEFYDLKLDPDERQNLIDDEAHAAVLSALKTQLTTVMQESGLDPANDKMPIDEGIKSALPDQKIR